MRPESSRQQPGLLLLGEPGEALSADGLVSPCHIPQIQEARPWYCVALDGRALRSSSPPAKWHVVIIRQEVHPRVASIVDRTPASVRAHHCNFNMLLHGCSYSSPWHTLCQCTNVELPLGLYNYLTVWDRSPPPPGPSRTARLPAPR
eukprot:1405790-Heterocapsa_arctica.AAC.1